jgi:hypothetical protein
MAEFGLRDYYRQSRSNPEMPVKSLSGKFDGSGVFGSTGRGLSQALESKVRFAYHSDTIA